MDKADIQTVCLTIYRIAQLKVIIENQGMIMSNIVLTMGVMGVLVGIGAILEGCLKSHVLEAVGKLILLTADRSDPLLSVYMRAKFMERRANIKEVLLTDPFITIFFFLVFLFVFSVSAGPLLIMGLSIVNRQLVIQSGWLAFWIVLGIIGSSWSIHLQLKLSKKDLTVSNVVQRFFRNYFVVGIRYSLKFSVVLFYTILLMLPAWIFRINVEAGSRRHKYYTLYAAILIILSVILHRLT